MTSSRLPGKVLMPVAGVPALTRLLRRLRRAQTLDDIVLATTVNATDEPLVAWAEREGVAVYRGSEEDVLARVVGAQRSRDADVVVEITGDCVLTDPAIIDMAVSTYFANACDVVSNSAKRGFPQGICVQVFPLELLADVAARIDDAAVREHVSLYFYEHPEQYRLIHLMPPPQWRMPEVRTQLDYRDDLAFLHAVYERLEPHHGDAFGIDDLCRLWRAEPGLLDINANCVERSAR